MNMRIIMASLSLVNGLASTAHAAIKVSKSDVSAIVAWVQETGKDREDYNHETAVLVDLKPGSGKSKARGVPGKVGEKFRYVYFFEPSGAERFILLKVGDEDPSSQDFSTYKIDVNGKVLKAFRIVAKLDEKGQAINPKLTILKLNSATRKLVAEEVDFWVTRAKQDAAPSTAPKP